MVATMVEQCCYCHGYNCRCPGFICCRLAVVGCMFMAFWSYLLQLPWLWLLILRSSYPSQHVAGWLTDRPGLTLPSWLPNPHLPLQHITQSAIMSIIGRDEKGPDLSGNIKSNSCRYVTLCCAFECEYSVFSNQHIHSMEWLFICWPVTFVMSASVIDQQQ